MADLNQILQERYRIIRPIAEGGMGAVYEAADQRLGSTVALKESFYSHESLRQAFQREASLLATLRHRGLPKVIDHFTEGERQYLVMELIPGDDLLKLLKLHKKSFPASDVMGWADQLLEALVYLHSQQPPVIHRDIKPANLKLDERGQIMLLDFGLAKEASLDTGQAELSVRGYTRHYAPIEQIKGTGTDRRSDLYSAAATIYHLMTGVVPADALTRANALLEGGPDPLTPSHTLNPTIPATVSEVLEQALMLDRNRRPENAQAMRDRLRQPSSAEVQSSPMTVTTEPLIAAAGPAASSTTLLETISIARTALLKIKGRSPTWTLGAAALALIVLVSTASYLIGAYRAQTAVNSPQNLPDTSTAQPDVAIPLSGIQNQNPAISVDPDKAIPLTSREFYGREPDANRLYSFVALPGLLKFTMNVAGGSINAEPFSSEKKKIEFDNYAVLYPSVSGSNRVDESLAQLKVDREQTILLRITSRSAESLGGFRLRIDGPAKLEEPNSPSPLAPLFADRLNPASLTSNTIYGGRGGKKDSYYVLTAGPGELAVQLNVIGGAAILGVDFERYIDHDNLRAVTDYLRSIPLERSFTEGTKLLTYKDDYGSVSGEFGEFNEEKILHLELKRQEKLLMYVSIGNHDNLQAYRVKLSGPIQFTEAPQSAQPSDSSIDHLKTQFAPRDNPMPLTSGIISGRNPEKESYYSFTAGPGAVNVSLNVESASGNLKVEFFSPELKLTENFRPQGVELRLLEARTSRREATTTLRFSREQRVVMRIVSPPFTSGGSLRYRVNLDGAVKFQ